MLAWAVVATFACGLLAIAAGALAYSAPRRWRPFLVSFAAGVLLAVAFVHLLPEAAQILPIRPLRGTFAVALAAVVAMFVLEAAVLHRAPRAAPASATLILAASALHNLTDGALIGAAFAVHPRLGVVATFAILAHEIPREVGNFAVFQDAGLARGRAVTLSAACRIPAAAGAVAASVAFSSTTVALPYVVAFAAGAFIYVATADLIPELKTNATPGSVGARAACMALGAVCIAAAGYWPR